MKELAMQTNCHETTLRDSLATLELRVFAAEEDATHASFGLSMIYLSPFSPFFWINMALMNRRRRRRQRRWGRNTTSANSVSFFENTNEEEAPFLAHPGSGAWSRNDTNEEESNTLTSIR